MVGVVGGDLLGLTESVLALVPRRCVHEAAVAALRELEMSWVVSRQLCACVDESVEVAHLARAWLVCMVLVAVEAQRVGRRMKDVVLK